ncbi:MAG: phosphate permease [Thermotogae bacterium]|nr:MAG: phosphate permease [Thermotogota bacterium]
MGMAFAIGANDVANSMATAVGAKAITPKQAVIIAAILEFLGAVLFGAHVTSTITKGIVDPGTVSNPNVLLCGAFAALVSSAVWILAATLWGMPVSTTHSIVGGMAGFGIAAMGWNAVNWLKLLMITSTWILSPLAGGALSYLVFKMISLLILRQSSPELKVKRYAPFIAGTIVFIIVYLFSLKTLHHSQSVSIVWSLLIAVIGTFVSRYLVKRWSEKSNLRQYDFVEYLFRKLQIMTSCYVSFSHGANDVANAIGPLAVIYWVMQNGSVGSHVTVPLWILGLGGIGISLGVSFLGYRVMKTVGEDLTSLNNTRGFSIDFSTATTVLVSSVLGMPVSTTHVVVGSVVGVGMARGIEVVNIKVLKTIVTSWLLTVPLAALLSAVLFSVFIRII